MHTNFEDARSVLKTHGVEKLDGVISTGSGQVLPLGSLSKVAEIPYRDVPGLDGDNIYGHEGVLSVVKNSDGKFWAIFTGRKHFYQGCDYVEIGYYIGLAKSFGANKLICLNAAGGLDPSLSVGDLVISDKFKNFIPVTEIPIPADGSDWTETNRELKKDIQEFANALGYDLKTGNYVGVPGPTYETEADVAWLRSLGASVVGMSTVPELIRGIELGMHVISVSAVANVHGDGVKLTHEEVVESSKLANAKLGEIIERLISGS